MSSLAAGSRRTRASMAAPSYTSNPTRSSTRDTSRRRSTANVSRTRFPDSSDLEYSDTSRPRQPLQPSLEEELGDDISEEDVDEEALEEQLVLEQITPRPHRRIRIDDVDLHTTRTALDRFRTRDQQGQRTARASIAGPFTSNSAVSRASRASVRSRQSAPLVRTSNSEQSGSRTMYTAPSELSVAPAMSRRSARSNASATNHGVPSADESAANTTMARPGQRLRPSANPNGRLDVPTIEERCAALIINAKGVLHFYMSLYTQGWQPESFDDMLRNWTPFESYKINQLLAEAQYMHHFIDIDEVVRSLRASGQPRPDGLEEAMKMANCATFVHYIHQLPVDVAAYGRRAGQSITSQDVVDAPLRNISELNDARRIFLRWIVPFEQELTDEILNMLLDMSIQIYINRLERVIEAVRAGTMAEDVARTIISDHLIDLMSGDIVRHSLQRVKRQRGMSRAEIERMVQRYETFANMRQIELQFMQYDLDVMRENFSYQSMSADLTGYVRDVVREVDAGMHSTTLPLIMDRLARESSVFSASDVPEAIPGSSSVIDDSSSMIAGPSQSTPKGPKRSTQPSQPFVSQYADWLDDMLDDDTQGNTQRMRPTQTVQDENVYVDLTDTQKVRELEDMLDVSTDDGGTALTGSVDLDIASSPPRTNQLGARLSAALNSSGRNQQQPAEPAAASESSDAAGEVERSRTRDGPLDSPAKAKAGRLGFDSQNRLVRRTSDVNRKNRRLLDGQAAAVRESRFDSQGDEEEDVFLDQALRKRTRGKGKGKASARQEDVEAAAHASPRPRRNLRSTAAQQRAATTENEAAHSDEEQRGVEERQTTRRTGTRSTAEHLQQPKQESLSPAKRRALQAATDGAEQQNGSGFDSDLPLQQQVASGARGTRSRAARIQNGDNGAATGLGRGLPDGRDAETQARILSTASGRLHEEGEGSDGDQDETYTTALGARNRVEGVNEELGAVRATPDDNFIGDDDAAILDRRAAMDAAVAAKKPRPGTLSFYRPTADDGAMPLTGVEDEPPAEGVAPDAIAMRNGDTVAEILRSSNTLPSRRIGPYHPGNDRTRQPREEADPTVDRYSSPEEIDELAEDDAAAEPGTHRPRRRNNTHREPLGQAVRVEPYKRSNLYITGHNMTGRSRWTQAETDCMLTSLHELARYKKVAPKFKVYTEILRRHGVNGTQSSTLARWNNVQLKDKSRNELMRMKREGVRIPYWKRLLHPNIWKPPPVVALGGGRRREETEDVPDVGSEVELPREEGGEAEDPIREVEEAEGGDAGVGDGVEVVIEGPVEDAGDGEGRSSNPLRNEA